MPTTDTTTKAKNFDLVERYQEMVNSLKDDPDCLDDVIMETPDQRVPVSSFYIKTETPDHEDTNKLKYVPNTPTILGDLSNYDSMLPPRYDGNGYNETAIITTTNNNAFSTYSNINIPTPVLNVCSMSTQTTDSSRKPQNGFTFNQSTTAANNITTPFHSYSQSVSSSPSHNQQHIPFAPSSLSSSLPSAQSQLWSMSSTASLSISSMSSPSLSSLSSLSALSPMPSVPSPSFQRQFPLHSPLSSTSPLLPPPSSPMMVNSKSPAPSPYSSSPSSLSSSPLLSSSSLSSAPSTTLRSLPDVISRSFVSEHNGSGCTVISGVPNFLNESCFPGNAGLESEMMMPIRNQEESLEYTDLDQTTELSFYDDLGSKDQSGEGGVPLEVIDIMREAIELDRQELNLPHNPQSWSASEASRWVEWVCRKHGVPDISDRLRTFNGACLCSWSDDAFKSISNTSGLSVFQELELWKAANFYNTPACHDDTMTSTLPFPIFDSIQALACTPSSSPALSHVSSNHSNVDNQHSFNSSMDNFEDEVFYSERKHTPLKSPESSSNSSSSTDSLKSVNLQKFKPRLGRGHKKAITLWQFLLDLLIGEKDNSDCIKWLNKDSRIFKIEDSKKVASLWGKVKSRPAMNYDKLSRSVRQYYRKGIIKKPEQTKRLVYQFCPGIC